LPSRFKVFLFSPRARGARGGARGARDARAARRCVCAAGRYAWNYTAPLLKLLPIRFKSVFLCVLGNCFPYRSRLEAGALVQRQSRVPPLGREPSAR